jgi:hypothetical protein
MALVLYSQRIVSSQQIRTGPGKLQELEQALAQILGIDDGNGAGFETVIKRAPFALHESGMMTASGAGTSGLSQSVPGIGGAPKTQQGLRLLDTSGDTQGMICVNGDYLEVYKDSTVTPDWETTPVWGATPVNKMNLTTGLWEVGGGKGCGVYNLVGSTVTHGEPGNPIAWDDEEFDTDDFWSGGSEVTVPEKGLYLMTASILSLSTFDPSYHIEIWFAINGGAPGIPIVIMDTAAAAQPVAYSGSHIASLSQSDYIEVWVKHNWGSDRSFGGYMSCFKLGEI